LTALRERAYVSRVASEEATIERTVMAKPPIIDKDDVDSDPMFATDEADKKRRNDNRLKLFFDRIDRLEEEKKGIADDIRDVYAEAKAVGYDTKIMRAVRRLAKMTPGDRAEYDALIDTYRSELGV
jgi:uncharacterized protein (UPF0335 family)